MPFINIYCLAAAAVTWSAAVAFADGGPKVDTSKPTPVIYPLSAQRAGEEGTVIVNVYISDGGKPKKVGVSKSSGFADLDNAAIETALNWHYLPAFRNGDTASEWTTVQVVYKLPEQVSR